jgi:diaminopimelate decarboxylase
MNTRAPVALRFNPDVDAKTHPYISTGLKKNKFGLQNKEILSIARDMNRYPAIQIRGISIHIGSQLLSLSPLSDSFEKLKELVQKMEPLLKEPLEFLDLGGGVGVTYKAEKGPSISAYCALIKKHFLTKDSKSPWRRYKIVLEPGRVISANAGALVTRVVYRKERTQKGFLIVDAAMNDLLRPALYGSYHDVVPLQEKRGTKKNVDVVGPVCETSDCLASDRKLPASLKAADLLAILSSGAYGFAMSGNYNSRPRPTEVLVQDGNFRVIRTRETYEDLIRGESL